MGPFFINVCPDCERQGDPYGSVCDHPKCEGQYRTRLVRIKVAPVDADPPDPRVDSAP